MRIEHANRWFRVTLEFQGARPAFTTMKHRKFSRTVKHRILQKITARLRGIEQTTQSYPGVCGGET